MSSIDDIYELNKFFRQIEKRNRIEPNLIEQRIFFGNILIYMYIYIFKICLPDRDYDLYCVSRMWKRKKISN